MTDKIHDVLIIGSGPAGYTAAVYTARANLDPLVIEGVTSGGALMTTTEVENFPGWPDGIMGPDLMDNMRKQAERFGASFVTDDATEVDLTGDIKIARVGDTEYRGHAVIIATGSMWRMLGLPNEQRLLGHGVSACATCDGFFFRDQDIAVIGGGDSAMEEATFLTRFARSVTIVHRRDSLRASKIMQERAFANDKIHFRWDTEILDVLGESTVSVWRSATSTQVRSPSWTSPGCSSPSATTRAPSCSAARSTSTYIQSVRVGRFQARRSAFGAGLEKRGQAAVIHPQAGRRIRLSAGAGCVSRPPD